MKKLCVIIGLLFTTSHLAQAEVEDSPATVLGERIAPCDYWNYATEARGYVCSRRPWSITVTTVDEVQRVIDALNNKIRDLESRVAALEAEKIED